MFNFLRNCQTVFQSGCSTLHSYKQCMRVPVSAHPDQQWLCLSFLKAILVGMNCYFIVLGFAFLNDSLSIFSCAFLSACLLGRNVYSNPSAIFLPTCSARASSTMLNRSGKSGDHCLLPDFRRNTFSLSLWSVKLVLWNSVQFCQMLFSIY